MLHRMWVRVPRRAPGSGVTDSHTCSCVSSDYLESTVSRLTLLHRCTSHAVLCEIPLLVTG